jgi:PAS domain S-box-containing protein
MPDSPSQAAPSAPSLSASTLGALLGASPAPMWIYDTETLRVLAVNDRALAYFGCDREHFPAMPRADAASEGIEPEALWRHRKGDGATIVMRLQLGPATVEDRPACLVAATDVTAEVEANRALRDSERLYRQLFEASSDYYWETDGQGRLTYLSGDYESVVGIPPAKALGKRLSDLPGVSIDPEMAKMARLAIVNKASLRDFVYSRTLEDGTKRWFKIGGVPLFDRNGTFLCARGVGVEITRHVEAQQAAQLAQSRLHDAVAHVSQPFVFYDADARVVASNQAFSDLNHAPGTDEPLFRGDSFRELAEWQLRVKFFAEGPGEKTVTLNALLAGYESGREQTYHLRDGRWMLVIYRPLPGGGRVGLWSDVTAIKRAEAERRALEEQLHHAQRLEAVGTLAGGVAHEINNALVPVIALTKIVAAKLPEGSRERRNLDMVQISAERSRDLLKQMLAFSRADAQPRDVVDLAVVTQEALRLMRGSLPATIRLESVIEQVPPMMGHSHRLRQMIVNLMTNAAQAIGERMGTVAIALRTDADGLHLRLSVSDTGCGMDDAIKTRIFEPFFTTKEVGKGTGLGLAVVHGIVKEHGGRIEVDSAPGRGSRFDVVLPLRPAATGAAA